jgi:hypothetical protein
VSEGEHRPEGVEPVAGTGSVHAAEAQLASAERLSPGPVVEGELESGDHSLTSLRDELTEVDGIPIPERVALFERANDTLAAELASLDEV